MSVLAYGLTGRGKSFEAMEIERRKPGPFDIRLEILYCGLCHTDVHATRDWGTTLFPCVPGHEIVGRVVETGNSVTRFAVGDIAGIGCIVDSCRTCGSCLEGLEQYCENGFTLTYNGNTQDPPGHTLGGYSEGIVVDENYAVRVTHSEDQLAAVAPLLCAGITTYSALRHWNVGPGKAVGIAGIGGLGHVAIKIANALGAHVVAFTTSESKRQEAHNLGAHEVVISRDPEAMKSRTETLDFILNTIAASHSLDPYLTMLKRDSTMAMVGVPNEPHPSPDVRLIYRRRRALSGSLFGGIAETQEMLDFCAKNGIVADIEMIGATQIDEAFDRMIRSDVKYRFVLDISTMASSSH